MQIIKNTVVSLHYKMYDADNQLIDQTQPEEPMTYLHGGYDGIFPLVEEQLQGKQVGDQIDVTMQAEEAFGDHEPELVRQEPIDVFPEDIELEVGMMFEADDPETGDVIVFRVTDITDGQVTVGGNHPLAGQTLRFEATVASVREATAEEIDHGHVHDGHHHH